MARGHANNKERRDFMSATRDGKMWRCQFYYKDWQGVSHKKNKRGFKTKAEAEQWERDFLQQQQRNLDINFENFVQIYYEDMEHRLRENTMRTKKFIIDLKIIPYFKKKNMNEIKFYLSFFKFSNIAITSGCVGVNFMPRFNIPITFFAFCSISLAVCSLVNIR